ncbi:MAG: hypothetical protein M3T49_06860, partial [Candidatus Eremiobacteraeota bacterium]|nr:hypothetical protein [Candidatus Eremiobacteraeota bacterium]
IPNGGYVTRAGSVMFSWWQIVPTTLAEATPMHWAVSPAFGPVLTLLAVAVILAGAWLARRTILPFWLAGAVVQIAGSLVSGKSLAIPRYLFPLVPAFAVAVGVLSAASLRRKVTLVALAVPLAVFTLCGICTENILLDPYYQFSDWYAINAVVLANEHRDDAMIFDQGFPALVVAGYSAFRHHSMATPNKPADVKAAIVWLDSHRGQRIWYIENQWFYADPAKAIKRHLDGTRKVIRIWSENRASAADLVNAVLYGPARSAAFARSPAKRR